ncbi:SMC family ATPase [Sphaerothrix gracilis]|uniref:SMC family ATPase n=1 Tax=Sphaerothrix gracilis TaxID=3151835 RepID=UPI0031FD890F
MQILSLTLKNFKAHSDRHFEFQPGTNAICGENGAGKTSLLEAIAWALFNYQGDYKREDLIRNGSSSAQVRVVFVSSHDSRTYEVQRCTSRGYTLFDPQLDQRLALSRVKDEVLPWLRQHLGVEPGTDLAQLFANTIGVPQGTFTADFLLPPDKRKPIFDTVLKVEAYRTVYKQSNHLRKYAEAQVEAQQREIAQYEESLQNWEALQQQQQQVSQSLSQSKAQLQMQQTELAKLAEQLQQQRQQAAELQQAQNQLQQAYTQLQARQQANQLLQQNLQQAQQAAAVCQAQQAAHHAYLQTSETLQQLEAQSQQQQQIQSQRQALERQLAQRQSELTRLTLQLEQASATEAELAQLQPLIQQQADLETQLQHINQQQQAAQQQQTLQRSWQQQLRQVASELGQTRQTIHQLGQLKPVIEQIAAHEQQRDRLQQQLSRVEAAQQFETELKQLVERSQNQGDRYASQAAAALQNLETLQESAPLLSHAAIESLRQAITEGLTLNQETSAAIASILQDLAAQTATSSLQQQLVQIRQQLQQGYQQRSEFDTLPVHLSRQQQLQQQQTELQQQLQALEQTLSVSHLQQQAAPLNAALAQLQDPRSRGRVLQQSLRQQPQIQSRQQQLAAAQAKVQGQISDLDQQLSQFESLAAQITELRQQQQAQQAGYLLYVQNQQQAQAQPQLAADLEAAIAELDQMTTAHSQLQQRLQQLQQAHDPKQLQQLEHAQQQAQSQVDRLLGSLPQQQQLLENLNQQLANLQQIAAKRDRAQSDLQQRDRVRRFINFARKVYKEAGPRITERYVQTISREADRLFRELLNRQNVALTWTRDYEILVQEGAHARRFINLSGGEQMCAALAVRLALLKVLADIDVAFFDEPTTNMDRPRRDSLAEAIARIRTFNQLFVISHDDTFEKVTENVILVEREN